MTPRPTEPERTTLVEDLASLADDVAKLIVLMVIFPLLAIAAMVAAEWVRAL